MALRRPFVELGWQHKELGNVVVVYYQHHQAVHQGLGTTDLAPRSQL
jgi:hypothetical protein